MAEQSVEGTLVWVRRYEQPLLRYATRIVGDSEVARDVVQDTFVRLLSADPARLAGKLPQWLYTVCRNRALDVRRRDARRKRPVPMGRGPATPAEVAERRRAATRALALLDALPDKQRKVLELKLGQGLSYKEIAARTGLTTSYVGYLCHHGLRSIRTQMEASDAVG